MVVLGLFVLALIFVHEEWEVEEQSYLVIQFISY